MITQWSDQLLYLSDYRKSKLGPLNPALDSPDGLGATTVRITL
jgi:hypothetical protein